MTYGKTPLGLIFAIIFMMFGFVISIIGFLFPSTICDGTGFCCSPITLIGLVILAFTVPIGFRLGELLDN